MTFEEEQSTIAEAAAKFPERFGLRAFPGEEFSIDLQASYWDSGYMYGKPHHEPGPMLYVYVHKDSKYLAFSKGTPAELRREVI